MYNIIQKLAYIIIVFILKHKLSSFVQNNLCHYQRMRGIQERLVIF